VIGKGIKKRREQLGMTQEELAKKLGFVDRSSISKIETGKNDISQSQLVEFANALQTTWSDLMMGGEISNIQYVTIDVFGSIPAGVPIEAIENKVGEVDIPMIWAANDDHIALKVQGDSMYPKYLDGDIVIIKLQQDCESGQDGVVYVNGYDATLKRIIKKEDEVILEPLNPQYPPTTYEKGSVCLLGVVRELRRKV